MILYRVENQYDYPSATKVVALEVEVSDFSATVKMSLGRGFHYFLLEKEIKPTPFSLLRC